MATASVTKPEGKYEFLVVVPDKPNVREQRLKVRQYASPPVPQAMLKCPVHSPNCSLHFENMVPFMEGGSWKMGGALLNSVPKDDDPANLDFMGSTLVCVAESVEQVREQLSRDIYATSGVWDMEKVSTIPVPETAVTSS
ncbi:hypothetical protein AK830_g11625 [Neonectria ditissima]|uniref:YCII-related domain-containing protein n=1 Tax=Neonectria ditissima TaxID=78410 RepID=A0A0P7B0W7_9HYPO|nr:hypothetical protein AK830_g11625 [Neonectria ditissima]